MEVKNIDERTDLKNQSKSQNKKSDYKLKGQNEKDSKTDVINLDKPINLNNMNYKSDYAGGKYVNNNFININDN